VVNALERRSYSILVIAEFDPIYHTMITGSMPNVMG
jgi:hypothetical protein